MEYVNKLYVGRLNRRTYLVSSLALGVLYGIVVGIINGVLGGGSTIGSLITLIIVIFVAVVGISFSARRFHDLGKSGWLVLLMLIPVVGFFVWLYLIFAGGNDASNTYGAKPKDAFELNKAFGMEK